MSYDPRANIGRFVCVETIKDGRAVAIIKNPQTGEPERFSERGLVNWLAEEREHNDLMPIDLKFNSAVQIGELNTALTTLQTFKIERGIALDAPLDNRTSTSSNVVSLSIPSF